jgi:hypothetical protein
MEPPMARPELSNLWLAFDAEDFASSAVGAEQRTPEEDARSRATLSSIKAAIARLEEESRASTAEQSRAMAAHNPQRSSRLEPRARPLR